MLSPSVCDSRNAKKYKIFKDNLWPCILRVALDEHFLRFPGLLFYYYSLKVTLFWGLSGRAVFELPLMGLGIKRPPQIPKSFQWVLPPREQTQGIKRSLILMFGNDVQKISSPFACAFLGVIQSSALLSLSSWKQCEVKSRCLFFKPG